MNNNLMIIESSNVLTMSSREIAELTGKQHKHVLTDIRNMLNSLNIDSAVFTAQYKDGTGRSLPMSNLSKTLAFLFAQGLRPLKKVAV